MKLVWLRSELLTVCQSESALRVTWPDHADDIMVLLTIIASAGTLGTLARLRSLRLTVDMASVPGRAPAFSMRYNEIQMEGILVDAQGKPLIMHSVAPGEPYWEQIGFIRIDSLVTRVKTSRREASS